MNEKDLETLAQSIRKVLTDSKQKAGLEREEAVKSALSKYWDNDLMLSYMATYQLGEEDREIVLNRIKHLDFRKKAMMAVIIVVGVIICIMWSVYRQQ